MALTTPAGSWLSSEGLHTLAEQEKIVNGVSNDSRLLWWTSQIPGLGQLALKHALLRHDFYAGLIVATLGSAAEQELWLRATALEGCETAKAASAALVLQPQAEPADKACWLAALNESRHARQAYETVRWSRYTWPEEAWKNLTQSLRSVCVGDVGSVCCQWFCHIAPQEAAAMLGNEGISVLWAVELLAARPDIDDYSFRFRLGEQLDTAGYSPASAVLNWLNQRWKRRHHATH